MEIVLHPRAPGDDINSGDDLTCWDRIRVWVGAFQATSAPALTWRLDGVDAQPDALLDIESVRSEGLLDGNPDEIPRTFAGLYEFKGLQPDTRYVVSVDTGEGGAELDIRTLPSEVPKEIDRSFNVLLVSCFHAAEDKNDLAGRIISELGASSDPHLTLLSGDQVYLDLPTLADFPDDPRKLAEKFERDYTTNWRGPAGFAKVLDVAPSISIPDDHEYWNNYPHPSPFIQNAWSQGGRDNWREAAQAMFKGFQVPLPNKLGRAFIIEVPPLSFFVADTRSNKDPDRNFTMPAEEHEQLEGWVTRVVQREQFGIFISGQSVFQDPVSEFAGATADYELPNYADYGQIMQTLQRLIDEGGRPMMCLTGDVHWGRVAAAQDLVTGRRAITEVISSPTSLVSTLGVDTVHKIGGFFSGIFGKSNPWPRHPDPAQPPAFLASDALGNRFPLEMTHGQKGNQVALLSFRQTGGGLECRITYWPIHSNADLARPIELEPFELSRM